MSWFYVKSDTAATAKGVTNVSPREKNTPPREIYASAAAVVATAMIVYLGDSFSRGENICDTQYSDGNPRNGGVECSWGRQKSRF